MLLLQRIFAEFCQAYNMEKVAIIGFGSHVEKKIIDAFNRLPNILIESIYVRDIDKCEEINFPVFCQKTNPIDAINYWALTEYQKNIIIKNVLIKPGDMIYASNDGVIRVKKSDFKKFKLKLNTIIKKENDVRKLIKSIKNKQDYKKPLLNFLKQKGRW